MILELPKITVAGKYKAHKLDMSGNVLPFLDKEEKVPAGSVISNALLDRFFTEIMHTAIQTWSTTCTLKVGTGTAPVEFTQTGLSNYSALKNGVGNSAVTSEIIAGINYVTMEYSGTFDLGALDGNYTEIGAWMRGNDFSAAVHSRALVVDPLGNPSAISVSATEQLVLTYLITIGIPWTVQTGTFTQVLNGVSSTVNYEAACAFSSFNSNTRLLLGAPLQGLTRCFNAGTIGAVGTTVGPSGVSTTTGSIVQAFPPGEKTSTLNLAILDRADPIRFITTDYFKWGFNPALPKTNARTLSITFRQQITRA